MQHNLQQNLLLLGLKNYKKQLKGCSPILDANIAP